MTAPQPTPSITAESPGETDGRPGLGDIPDEAVCGTAVIVVQIGNPSRADFSVLSRKKSDWSMLSIGLSTTAVTLDATFVPGWVNLADARRASGGEAEAERVLRDAAERSARAQRTGAR